MTRSTTRGSVGATGSKRTARPFEAHAAANRPASGGGVGDSVGDMLFTMSAAAAMLVSIISRAGVPLRVGLEKPGSLCPGGSGGTPAHGQGAARAAGPGQAVRARRGRRGAHHRAGRDGARLQRLRG